MFMLRSYMHVTIINKYLLLFNNIKNQVLFQGMFQNVFNDN